jgi:hypothetical protein
MAAFLNICHAGAVLLPCRVALTALVVLHLSVAIHIITSLAVAVVLQCTTQERSLLCCAPHHAAHMVAWPVITCTLSPGGIAATVVADVTPATAKLQSAGMDRILL